MQQSTPPHLNDQSISNFWTQIPELQGPAMPSVAQIDHPAAVAASAPLLRTLPYTESAAWGALKSLVQLAVVVTAVLIVLSGAQSPRFTMASAAMALLLMGIIVIADRQRFAERDPAFEIVQIIEPERVPEPVATLPYAPLTPLAEHMAVALPDRIRVT